MKFRETFYIKNYCFLRSYVDHVIGIFAKIIKRSECSRASFVRELTKERRRLY